MDLNDIWIFVPITNVRKSVDIMETLKQKLEMGNEIMKMVWRPWHGGGLKVRKHKLDSCNMNQPNAIKKYKSKILKKDIYISLWFSLKTF